MSGLHWSYLYPLCVLSGISPDGTLPATDALYNDSREAGLLETHSPVQALARRDHTSAAFRVPK
ncbi:MAG: hypothetical protein Q7T80_16885 [Methanoregula sp.]|nr:hypothetical protein [Methanoregula sp.]